MPWAGYERQIAPNLTALEKESVSYTRGHSISSYTAKSVGGLLAGRYPSSLYRNGFFFTKYPESNLMFPELLQKAGIRTLAGHAHMYMGRDNGMDQGFDSWKLVDGITFNAKTDRHVTSHKLTPLAIDLLKATGAEQQFFMYLHYMDPHDEYVTHEEAPQEWGKQRLRDRYDQEMFYTDLWIGKLLDYCKSQPWWSHTVVIVSADHGEGFGEHKVYRHAFHLWEILTHVPLFFRVPGVEGRRIDTPRGHIDLAPTILDLMGLPPEPSFAGKSLAKELRGDEEAEERPVILDLPSDSNNPRMRAVILGDYKLLVFENGWKKDLYDLRRDPGETKDLARREPKKFEAMKTLFESEWAKVGAIKPFGGNKLKDGSRATGPKGP